jgi:hypothetical protein
MVNAFVAESQQDASAAGRVLPPQPGPWIEGRSAGVRASMGGLTVNPLACTALDVRLEDGQSFSSHISPIRS